MSYYKLFFEICDNKFKGRLDGMVLKFFLVIIWLFKFRKELVEFGVFLVEYEWSGGDQGVKNVCKKKIIMMVYGV